jgi:anti-sigma regulatory factor (Ser/Thr protein kinase)
MPGLSGLDLLAWIREQDPSLATILVTAEGEKSLVAATLRQGATDFLEKPVEADELARSVGKAVDITARRRRFRAADEALREVGRIKGHLQGTQGAAGLPEPELRLYAQTQVGGDFANYLPVGDGKVLLLCGDVSGHDLKAGFVSAYFQGMVRGLLAKQTPVREIARFFNDLLLREWNQGDGELTRLSVAACFILIDFTESRMTVLNCGFPALFLCDAAGRIRPCEHQSQPLGWFCELAEAETRLTLPEPHSLCLYTDGLEDVADAVNADPCAVVYRLLDAERDEENRPLAASFRDDVLALRLPLPGYALGDPPFQPLFFARYGGDQIDRIDALQDRWRNSLQYAIGPDLGDRLYDVVACCREAMINALRHGCGEDRERTCELHIAYRRWERRLRLRVDDPGDGHDFDIEARMQELDSLRERNLGLIMVHLLSDGVSFERHGATVIIDFVLRKETTA